MSRVSDENLSILIEGLKEYKEQGVIDPWILGNGETVQPLDVLIELQQCRDSVSNR